MEKGKREWIKENVIERGQTVRRWSRDEGEEGKGEWEMREKKNQSTKVNIWSAVPFPCFFFLSDFRGFQGKHE